VLAFSGERLGAEFSVMDVSSIARRKRPSSEKDAASPHFLEP
jgi:hypothetical protein